jgi:hypothetical protein
VTEEFLQIFADRAPNTDQYFRLLVKEGLEFQSGQNLDFGSRESYCRILSSNNPRIQTGSENVSAQPSLATVSGGSFRLASPIANHP